MGKKEEFKKLIETVLNENSQSEDSRDEILIGTTNVLQMLANLNQQIEEQREYINSLEKQIKIFEGNFKTLINALTTSGYIDLSERRKLLKRNILTQEALINLLKKKRFINMKDLLMEIKKLK
jgi:predicted S18 family serine protease